MLSSALDNMLPSALRRLHAAKSATLFVIVGGCAVVAAASLGAGIYQAEGADLFEQLSHAAKVSSCI
jgi:hypothetical protein